MNLPRYLKILSSLYGIDKAAEELLKTADARFSQAQFFEAKQYYIKLTKMFPHSKKIPYTYYKIAECYKRMGAYDKALTNYKKILTLGKIEEGLVKKTCFGLAGSFYAKRKYPSAVQSLNIFLKRFPHSKSILTIRFYLGYFYYKGGNHPEAKRAFERLLRDYPSSSFTNLAKGFIRSLSNSSR